MTSGHKMHGVRLFTESLGSGPELVMLHGWGMHSGIWRELAEALARRHRVTLVDLPGHGRSLLAEGEQHYNFGWVARQVAEAVPAEAAWIGWSLGGLVALRAALDYPKLLSRLVLVASSPRFVQGEGWPHAISAELLELFSRDLEQELAATLIRFLALQTRGSENAQEALRRLRARLFRHGEPHPAALRGGLAILRDGDLRAEVKELAIPVRALLGERDTVVPAAVGPDLDPLFADGRHTVLGGAGHAPFLSHPEPFLAALEEALRD